MKINFPENIFVTGTGTDVGKTVVSGMLLCGLDASYWKPVQSGRPTDTDYLKASTSLPSSRFKPETYVFEDPLSPHLAAQLASRKIDLEQFQIPQTTQKHMIIEGAGGVLVPLNDVAMMADLISSIKAPVLIVAHSKLGTINHTLLTIRELRSRSIEIFGVIMNGPLHSHNKEAVERYGDVRVLAELEELTEINQSSLRAAFQKCFGDHYDSNN